MPACLCRYDNSTKVPTPSITDPVRRFIPMVNLEVEYLSLVPSRLGGGRNSGRVHVLSTLLLPVLWREFVNNRLESGL